MSLARARLGDAALTRDAAAHLVAQWLSRFGETLCACVFVLNTRHCRADAEQNFRSFVLWSRQVLSTTNSSPSSSSSSSSSSTPSSSLLVCVCVFLFAALLRALISRLSTALRRFARAGVGDALCATSDRLGVGRSVGAARSKRRGDQVWQRLAPPPPPSPLLLLMHRASFVCSASIGGEHRK